MTRDELALSVLTDVGRHIGDLMVGHRDRIAKQKQQKKPAQEPKGAAK